MHIHRISWKFRVWLLDIYWALLEVGQLCFKLSDITGTLSDTPSLAKRIPKASNREILDAFKFPMILIALSKYWFMWYERVKRGIEGSNPTFLAAEGSSTHPRILGAPCRSTAEARKSRGQAVRRYLMRLRIMGFWYHYQITDLCAMREYLMPLRILGFW